MVLAAAVLSFCWLIWSHTILLVNNSMAQCKTTVTNCYRNGVSAVLHYAMEAVYMSFFESNCVYGIYSSFLQ